MQFTFTVEASLVNNPDFYRLYANFLEQTEALKQPQIIPQPARQRGPRAAQEQPPKRARRNPGPSHSGLEDLRAAFEARAPQPEQDGETKKILNLIKMLIPTFVRMSPVAYQKAAQATVDYFQFACDHLDGKIVTQDAKLELIKRAQIMVQEWLATDALDVLCNHFSGSNATTTTLLKQTITVLLNRFAAAPEETIGFFTSYLFA